jgi:hypothetical protein
MRADYVIRRFLAGNRGVDGAPPPYLIDDADLSEDGVLSFTMRFASGKRYCCGEAGCHLGFLSTLGWTRLRHIAAETELALPRPLQARVRIVAEAGAIFTVLERLGLRHDKREEYEVEYSELDATELP